jgi:hypothetical protein
MNSSSIVLMRGSVRMVGNLFKGDDSLIFERAIACGYFNSVLQVL